MSKAEINKNLATYQNFYAEEIMGLQVCKEKTDDYTKRLLKTWIF